MKNFIKYLFGIFLIANGMLLTMEPVKQLEEQEAKKKFSETIIPTLKQMILLDALKKIIQSPQGLVVVRQLEELPPYEQLLEEAEKETPELATIPKESKLIYIFEKKVPSLKDLPLEVQQFLILSQVLFLPEFKKALTILKPLDCIISLAHDEELGEFNAINVAFDPENLNIAISEINEYKEKLNTETDPEKREELEEQIAEREYRIKSINCVKNEFPKIFESKFLTNLWISLLFNPDFKSIIGSKFHVNELLRSSFEILLTQNKFEDILYWFKNDYSSRKIIFDMLVLLFKKTPDDLVKTFLKYTQIPIDQQKLAEVAPKTRQQLLNNIANYIRLIPINDIKSHRADFLISNLYQTPNFVQSISFLRLLFLKGASPNIQIKWGDHIISTIEYFFGVQGSKLFIEPSQNIVKTNLAFIKFLIENGLDITPLQVEPIAFEDPTTVLGAAQRNYNLALQNNSEYRDLFEKAQLAYEQMKVREEKREKEHGQS